MLLLAIALSTLVSEDLALVAAGTLAASGRIGLAAAILAGLAGIIAGDLLLFAAGRWLGPRLLERAPVSWILGPAAVEGARAFFASRGAVAAFLCRFIPGLRLPTYLAAGMFGAPALSFILWVVFGAVLWTPVVVVAVFAADRGAGFRDDLLLFRTFPLAVASGLVVLLTTRFGVSLLTHRGRRLLLSRWRRLTRWEYWPIWAFYPPVVAYALYLGWKHGGLTTFCAANPGMPQGGFVGESKSDILQRLAPSGAVARFRRVPARAPLEVRLEWVREFMSAERLSYPIVLKPDVGERGSGVVVAPDEAACTQALRAAKHDLIVQEHVPGVEFGVFYARRPGAERGWIFSITEKRFPAVVGDGRRTLEELILDDPVTNCMARFHLRRHRRSLARVPAAGESVPLVELGSHCRGAQFLDGGERWTAALAGEIDRISRTDPAFHFGRFDVRAASVDEFQAGRLRVIELNGVTSESTNIYHPGRPLRDAYRILFSQWRLAFEIGREQRAHGVAVPTAFGLLSLALGSRRPAAGVEMSCRRSG